MNRKDKMSNGLITRFLSGKRLNNDEIVLLEKLFSNKNYNAEISDFLRNSWQQSESADVELTFEEIKKRIRFSSEKSMVHKLFGILSKAAAVLFIPLLATALYFYFNQPYSHELLTFATQKGEQTNVILPDGSEVWLNVDTKLSLPVDYGIKNRDLTLVGEAYFEVEKNEKLPFKVTSGNITTEALGTQFVVSAYPESSAMKTSLLEGSVKVTLNNRDDFRILKPGQQLNLVKKNSSVSIESFNKDYVLSWKNDELVFHLAPFDEVITKLEKWYNIDIEYNPALFKAETLTVRFEKYETLENVLKVISKANDFSYSNEGKYIKIMKKK